jgi:Domain of unknown function (DUF4345)
MMLPPRLPAFEKRLLQVCMAAATLVPLIAGTSGAVFGPTMVGVTDAGGDLDSHYRYLSGLLGAIGLAFVALIPTIERQMAAMRLLTFLVVIGGLARLAGLALGPPPGWPHYAALAMELAITPALCLWQGRVARRGRRNEQADAS